LTTAGASGTVVSVYITDNTEVVMRARLAALSALLVLAVPPAASAWTWPVDGPVLRPFSFGSDPYGAAAGGVVSFAGTVPNGGKTVTIQTSTGYAVTLVHLGSIRVLRGTAVEEGATIGTVGPSGVPDIPEPYVYLGIRVASDDQGYLDPLRFLPPRADPPAAPAASDPPSTPAGESSGSEPSAPPVAAEPPPAPPADADGEPPSETSDESATTPEPASERVPAAGAEQPPATAPVADEAPAAQVAEAASADPVPAPGLQGGGRAVVPAEEPAAALGGSARAGTSPSDATIATEPSVAPTVSVAPVEHHATPAGAMEPARARLAAVVRRSQEGAVVQTPLVRATQPSSAGPDAVRGADATERGESHPHEATSTHPHDGLWIAAALASVLLAALAVWRHRRRPGATPADPEAPRMMVLVGGLQHEADARRVGRPMPTQHDERLAA
jgi:hypothetical protein